MLQTGDWCRPAALLSLAAQCYVADRRLVSPGGIAIARRHARAIASLPRLRFERDSVDRRLVSPAFKAARQMSYTSYRSYTSYSRHLSCCPRIAATPVAVQVLSGLKNLLKTPLFFFFTA